jgi:prepilin-type N-terminal cleavage/methylation domain-containing protein
MQSTHRSEKRERGFTLIELGVVVMIVGAGLLAALPNLKSTASRNRVTDATRRIESALQLARMKAINEGKDHVVQFSPGGWNIFVDNDKDGVRDSDDRWLYAAPIRLPPQVRYAVPTGPYAGEQPPQLQITGCQCARWQSNGTLRVSASTTTMTAALQSGSDYRRLSLSVAGAMKFQRWTGYRWE